MIKFAVSILSCYFLFYNSANAQNISTEFSEDDLLEGAGISVVFFDAITGESLDEFNSDLLLCPASTWKILTTTAAAEKLKKSDPFTTKIYCTGFIDKSTLKGDLIVKGFGDPTLGSDVFVEDFRLVLSSVSEELRRLGINKIEGRVLSDASWLDGLNLARTRIWEDMGNYYGGPISGLNFADNSYDLFFNTRLDPGKKAILKRIHPEVPGLSLESEVLVSTLRSDQAYIFGSPLESVRVIYGTLPSGYDDFKIKGSLPDPAYFLAFHLFKYLEENGIASQGFGLAENHLISESTLLFEFSSPPLKEIIREVIHNSNNLYAEALTAKLGEKDHKGNLLRGVEFLSEYFRLYCLEHPSVQAFDGSGLSRFNAISANQMKALLLYCRKSPQPRELVLEQLPYFGKEGTVKGLGRGTELENNVRAKSGSMTGVIAYTGFMNAKTGREIGFSIMLNNFNSDSGKIRERIQSLLLEAYRQF